MLRSLHRRSLALGILIVLAGWPSISAGHEKGVLKLADRRLAAGDSVRLVGEKFPKAARLVLLISGPSGGAFQAARAR